MFGFLVIRYNDGRPASMMPSSIDNDALARLFSILFKTEFQWIKCIEIHDAEGERLGSWVFKKG